MREGRMTPQQARQFLEAQKQGEQTLIFVPPQKENRRVLRDW